MHTAMMVGRSFSVVTTLARTRGRALDLANRYVAAGACRGVWACDIPVLDLEGDPAVLDRVVDVGRTALDRDGSDVLVLGCAGMADLCQAASAELGVPVVDGVTAATVLVESLVTLRLGTSRRDEYARPPAKAYTGLLEGFTVS